MVVRAPFDRAQGAPSGRAFRASPSASRGAGKLLVIALLLWVTSPALRAQESDRPMSEAELISLVNAKTLEDRLIEMVRARGVAFKPSAALDEGLRKLKLTRLLATLTEPGTLEVTVNVPGADVLVDGEKRGAAGPDGTALVSDVAPGEHSLDVRAESYVEASQKFLLKPGETRRLEVALRAAVSLTPGPLGSRISVQAGTPADAALAGLEFARSGGQRIEMLKKLVADFGENPLALLGYGMLQETYLEEQQYDESLAAGEEVLKRDPKSFTTRVRQAHAYLGKGEAENALKAADQARTLLDAAATAVPPMGADAEAWQREKQQALEAAQNEWNGLSYSAYVGLSQVADPGEKRALLEHYLHIFPQSAYRPGALVVLAVAAQQQGDAEAMRRYADEGLAANPDSPMLLMLVSDVLSERGQELARARQLAAHLLELVKSSPGKVRPEGLSDEQWAQVSQLWEGTAHSVLGQVLMYEETAQGVAGMNKTRQAVEEFKAASPLLKSNPYSYARNLYRLGYAYAKLGLRPQAREALTEVMSLDTPYRQVAGPLLEKVK